MAEELIAAAAKVKVEGDLASLDKSLKDIQAKITGFSSNASTAMGTAVAIGTTLANIITAIAKAALAAAEAFLRWSWAKFTEMLHTTDSLEVSVRNLANEIGNVGEAGKIIDDLEKKAVDWGVATDQLVAGYMTLRKFFDDKFIANNLEDIASASKNLGIPIDTLAHSLAGLNEGILSTRRLVAMGISKEALAGQGIKFDSSDKEKIISSAKEVLTAIMAIYHQKYTEGAGKDIGLFSEMITRIKDLWGMFNEEVGKAGIYDAVVGKLKDIVKYVQANWDTIKEWAKTINDTLLPAFNGLLAVIQKITGVDLGTGKVKLTPFWDDILKEIQGGTVGDRLSSAIGVMLDKIANDPRVGVAAAKIGSVIGTAIKDALTPTLEGLGNLILHTLLGEKLAKEATSGDLGSAIYDWTHSPSGTR